MSDAIQATWSDAAREAALASRKAHSLSNGAMANNPFVKDGMIHMNTAPSRAFAGAHASYAVEHADKGNHSTAATRHKDAAEGHRSFAKQKDTPNKDAHLAAAAAHDSAAILHKALKTSAKATSTESSDVVRAAGTSDGAKKGWGHRVHVVWTDRNYEPHKKTFYNDPDGPAGNAHAKAKKFANGLESSHGQSKYGTLRDMSIHHEHEDDVKAFDTTNTEVVHCRASSAAGAVLAADKAWNAGEPVEFMWMPAGRHTICAGFRNGSIELTVNCDENTAANVQASLDQWRTERPKQEPFGCIEHREHEASVRVSAQQAFSFKQDGVYIAAEPTVLGAQNVNGKVHRSWSPSFTTDADYSQAKVVKTASGATVMVFPEGVRGSRSNPAEITGVDFCVGTLTNKPAFHAMSPVKGSEAEDAVTATGTSEGAKKGWASRVSEAHDLSNDANEASNKLSTMTGSQKLNHHFTAGNAHLQARAAHRKLAEDASNDGMHAQASYHQHLGEYHNMKWQQHISDVDRLTKASSATQGDQVHAHCRATLLQDIPDATAAEIACYDKCIDEGGSHMTAVTEIKSQRKPEHVTQKASDELTPDSIYAALEQRTAAANTVATEAGVISVEDVYEKVTATGTSEGAKKGWEVRMHSDQSGRGTFTTLHLEHAESRDDAYAQAAKKGKGTAFPWVGSAKMKKDAAKATDATPQDILNRIYARAGENR